MKGFILAFGLLLCFGAVGQSNLVLDWKSSNVTSNAAKTEWTVTINDPACPGSPVLVTLTMSGSGVDDVREGSTGPVDTGNDTRLSTSIKFDNYTESLQYKISFNKPVTNVSFRVFQIDRTATTSATVQFQDQVTVSGSPTITPPTNPNFQTISGNVITGIENISSTAASNAPRVSFGSASITNIDLDWRNGPAANNYADYVGQVIGIGNISFTTTGCALPIELSSFQAKNLQEGVAVNWLTTKEQDNDYFEVHRSRNAKNFESIGRVNGVGNSSEKNAYSFTDIEPFAGWNYYRLKQVDLDGTYSFTKIIGVFYKPITAELNIYPNPAQDFFKVKNALSNATINIYDMIGKKVQQSYLTNDSVDITNLPDGIYIVEIKDEEINTKQRLYIHR